MLKWTWRALFSCFVLSAGWCIHRFIIQPSGPFGWDEAAHSLKGLLIAHDLKTGDWLGFLYDTYKQVYWPPLHSWLTGIAFLIWSPSTVVARTVSLVFFLLTILVIYLAGLQLGQPRREIAATIAASLFLTAPLVVFVSGLALVEAAGLFFVSLTVFVYIWLNAKPRSPVAHAWLGITIILAYFTKTNYGILLFLVWLTATGFSGGKRALISRSSVYVILPLVITFAVWFAYPPKIHSTLLALINIPWGDVDPYSLQGFLFFPKAVLHFFGSVWQSLIPVIALLLALKFWANPALRFLLLLALIQFGLALAHHTRDERHILPMLPAMVLITGFVVAHYWSVQGQGAARWVTRSAAIGLCLSTAILLPKYFPMASGPSEPAVADRVISAVKNYRSTLVLGTTEIRKPSPPTLDWQLASDDNMLPITHSGVTMNYEEDRKILNIARKLPLPAVFKNGLEHVTSRGELPSRMRSIYLGLYQEYSYAGDVEKARALLRRIDSEDPFEVIAVLTLAVPGRDYPFEFVDEVIRPLGFEHVSTESYPGTKDRFDFYRRTP